MIKKVQEIKHTLNAKGQLVKIDEEGLHIYDKKTEEVEVLSFEDFNIFVGSEINITVAESTKQDIKVEEEEEEDDGSEGDEEK